MRSFVRPLTILNEEILNMLIYVVGDGSCYLLLVLDEVVLEVVKLRVLFVHSHELFV